MRINTNPMAMSAQRNLSNTSVALGKSIERLSSGLRINRAGDDAAGLVISQKLRAESSGLRQAVRNAQDGISFVQTAEGALDEVSAMLNRQRDLVVQARNGSQGTDSIAAIQAEFDALSAGIDRIRTSTVFAGQTVFGAADVDFQVGNSDTDQITVSASSLTLAAGSTASVEVDGTLAAIDTLITGVSTSRGELGATQNRFESTIRNLTVTAENLSSAESRIRDVDIAEEMVNFTRSQILQQAGTAMLAQSNAVPQGVLQLLG